MSNCTCCHHHEHSNEAQETRSLKLYFARLIIAFALAVIFTFIGTPFLVRLSIFALAFLIAGYEIVWGALTGIIHGKIFDENFLMTIASISAFVIGEYTEAVAIIIFFGAGELLQGFASAKSKKNIVALMDIRPDLASVKREGQLIRVNPQDIEVGEIITVMPGEKIALDGVVVSGSSFIDTKSITGEPKPVSANVDDNVLSGTVNTQSALEIKVTKPYNEGTVAKIIDLVKNSAEKKSKSEKYITRFARVYTPIVVCIAIIVATLPPLLGSLTYSAWLYRAISFLVISCPCALVVSIPVSIFGGIGGSARNGILIKGGNHLDTLSDVRVVAFDKTGTLTEGVFEVSEIIPNKTGDNKIDQNKLLEITATAEQHSPHPIAKSILAFYGKTPPPCESITEHSGKGITAKIDGKTYYIGNAKLLSEVGINNLKTYAQTTVYVARENEYLGCILISDKIKDNTVRAISDLANVGITRTIMLTGDNKITAREVAKQLGITEYHAELLPHDKVAEFEKIASETTDKIAFVGDGMNDAPVLTRADIGIAMGGIGSDASIESADVVLMNDDLSKIAIAKQIARKTKRIIAQNIGLALSIKFGVMALAFFGITQIWLAIFADVGVALLAIANATRCLAKRK